MPPKQEDLYEDAAPSPAEPQEPGTEEPEGDDTEQTTLIPASALMGKDYQPGDTLTLRVVQMTEDGALVKVEGGEEENEEPEAKEGGEEATEPKRVPGPMDSMME